MPLGLAVALAVWVVRNPEVQAAVGSEEEIRRLVEVDFEAYYSESSAGGFAAQVWSNNAWVSALCIAFGISGVGVVWVLLQNAANVGTSDTMISKSTLLAWKADSMQILA